MKHKGSCHCGQIAFEVEGDIPQVLSCNCSICQRKGSLLWFVPKQAFELLTRPDKMSTYTFNKHVIRHRFCPTCGMHPFGEGKGADGKEMAAINVRCLEGIDLETLKVQHYDGRSK
ncbi:MAG TPA: GFA family protein [Usitatibacter sp.]|nr:GFA family protein [Usitatibacter sp.]